MNESLALKTRYEQISKSKESTKINLKKANEVQKRQYPNNKKYCSFKNK